MRIRINTTALWYWVIVFALELAFVLYAAGGLKFGSADLTMTESQAVLARGAISLVVADIDRGVVQTTEAAISALSAELPSTVREKVLTALGTPDFDEISISLAKLSDKIVVEK